VQISPDDPKKISFILIWHPTCQSSVFENVAACRLLNSALNYIMYTDAAYWLYTWLEKTLSTVAG